MIEPLGPNMARTVMGDAYNPDYKYELETNEEGFHVIITNPKTGESSNLELEPEKEDRSKLTAIWDDELLQRKKRGGLLSSGLFWLLTILFVGCIVAAVLPTFLK